MPYKTFTLTFAVLDDKTIKFLKKDEKTENGDLPIDGIDVYDGSVKIDGAIENVIKTHFTVAPIVVPDVNITDDNNDEANTVDDAEAKGEPVEVADNNNSETKDEPAEVADNNNAETKDEPTEVVDNKDTSNDDNVEGAEGNNRVNNSNVGGSRKAQSKNVSFSKKYPKNKSNKKTLRNLERILSH